MRLDQPKIGTEWDLTKKNGDGIRFNQETMGLNRNVRRYDEDNYNDYKMRCLNSPWKIIELNGRSDGHFQPATLPEGILEPPKKLKT